MDLSETENTVPNGKGPCKELEGHQGITFVEFKALFVIWMTQTGVMYGDLLSIQSTETADRTEFRITSY